MVASRVVSIFKDISEMVKEFIIIGGNHDYYSPNSDSVDTINLLLGHLNIKIVTKQTMIDKESGNLYIPWYQWLEMPQMIQNLIDDNNIKRVFTHADIINEPVNIRCDHIYSGHIHIPYCNGKLRNLGSTYALNFADANQPRGFYVIHEDDRFEFIENKESIKFHRLYNEDIFTKLNMSKSDYIELYINRDNMAQQSYMSKIDFITKNWKNVWIIPQVVVNESIDNIEFSGYNIEYISRELVPENLKEKFEVIVNSCK